MSVHTSVRVLGSNDSELVFRLNDGGNVWVKPGGLDGDGEILLARDEIHEALTVLAGRADEETDE